MSAANVQYGQYTTSTKSGYITSNFEKTFQSPETHFCAKLSLRCWHVNTFTTLYR